MQAVADGEESHGSAINWPVRKSQPGGRRLLKEVAAIEELVRHSMTFDLAGRFIQHEHCGILRCRPTQVKHVADGTG
jgi:hypothetical protein